MEALDAGKRCEEGEDGSREGRSGDSDFQSMDVREDGTGRRESVGEHHEDVER